MKVKISKLKARIAFVNKLIADMYTHNLFSPEETAELSSPLVSQVLIMQEMVRELEAEYKLLNPQSPQV